ncbi:hypothetical protein ACIA5C_41680 [Actinoplanes sp. NPDC051343]|uniref:hypothetical protein n=1 Tax=Actinoplanes sp. NPDC051343 TaxID=3363906 RepID=UPI0037A4CD92
MTVIATLTVTRPAGSWAARLRPHEIVVDDVSRGRLAAGRSLSLALPPGRHRVRAGHGDEIEVHLGPGTEERLILDGTSLRGAGA